MLAFMIPKRIVITHVIHIIFSSHARRLGSLSSTILFCGGGVPPANDSSWARINNWNILKDVKLTESKTLEFCGELFNAFNHAQFYGSGAFCGVFGAAAPRVAQVAAKIIF